MLIPNKHSGYLAGIRLYPGGKGGGGAPAPDPQVGQALLKQAATGDRLLDFVMKSYEENKPLELETKALNNELTQKQIAAGDKASERADEAYDFYQTKGRPMVEKMLDDAQNWDSEGNLGKVAGDAKNDIDQQFDVQQQNQNRMLQSLGINPNSGKFAELNAQMSAGRALGTAGAMNTAVGQRKMEAVNLRGNATNVAQGMPAQVMGFAGGAGTSYGGAAGTGNANIGMVRQGQQQVVGGMNAGAGIYGSVAGGYNDMYRTQMNGYAAQQDAEARSAAGLGSLAGTAMSVLKLADGGKVGEDGGAVRGPGTGTSDEVPAVNKDNGGNILLSNGEYVISADVVKAKGKEFFDKLQQKYHTPVGNVGRAA